MNGFVTAYNTLAKTIGDLRNKGLQGDRVLLAVESQFQKIFNSAPAGLTTSLKYLAEIGITTTKTGQLTLDGAKFDKALEEDYQAVAQLFSNDDQGYAFRLNALAETLLDSKGLISARTTSLDEQKDDLAKQQANIEFRLAGIEKSLRAQFSSLDALISNLTASGNFLSQQLANLPQPLNSSRR